MSRGHFVSAVFIFAASFIPLAQASAGTFTTLYRFQGGTTDIPDGEYPIAGVILDDTGNILSATFGTVGQGGEPGKKCPKCDNNGSIDVIKPDGGLAQEPYIFQPGKDGAFPAGELVLNNSGAVYGTTEYGPSSSCGGLGCGTVFKSASSENLQPVKIAGFCQVADCLDGVFPRAGLTPDGKGNLFGTTLLGGSGSGYLCGSNLGGCGVVYEISGDTDMKLGPPLYSFCTEPKHNLCSDGAVPAGRLLYRKGKFYGTTEFGGLYGQGTVFELSYKGGQWNEKVLYSFCADVKNGICADGAIPEVGVVADGDGNLYGTTTYGGYSAGPCDGNPGCGVVFALTPGGSETVLHEFQGYANNDGALPMGQLAIDQTSNILYGTTLRGQRDSHDCVQNTVLIGCGTIFTLTTTAGDGSYTVIHTFQKKTDGAHPQGALLLSNSTLYGTARSQGGKPCNCGTIYSYTVALAARAVKAADARGGQRRGKGHLN